MDIILYSSVRYAHGDTVHTGLYLVPCTIPYSMRVLIVIQLQYGCLTAYYLYRRYICMGRRVDMRSCAVDADASARHYFASQQRESAS
jgi:hypothetical protein